MVDFAKYLDKSFRNPYLKTVAFEIRFPSFLKVLENFSNFQEKVNIDYPNYSEEFPFPTTLPDNLLPSKSFRRIKLSNDNKTSEITISHNALNINENQYLRFKQFQEIVNNVVGKFIKCFPEIKKITRIGLRYINQNPLGVSIEDARKKFVKLYVPFYNTEIFSLESQISHNIEIRKQVTEDIVLTYRSQILENEEKKMLHIIDFDAYSSSPVDIVKYEELLPRLRIENKKAFLTIVTEDFMKEMKFYEEEG